MKAITNQFSARTQSPGIADPIRNPQSAIRNGFTLTEVMFAIMILGVGLIAIATIFPVASSIQKTTTDEIISLQVAENAKAVLASKGIPLTNMLQSFKRAHTNYDPAKPDSTVFKVFRLWTPNASLIPSGAATVAPRFADVYMAQPNDETKDVAWFTEEDRSYPYSRPLRRPDAGGKVMTNFDTERALLSSGNVPQFVPDRDYYWYPLFRRKLDGSWNAYIFIMHRVPQGLIPQVEEVLITTKVVTPEQSNTGFTTVELDKPRAGHTGVNNVASTGGSLVAADIQPGTWILDSAGNTHRVLERTGNTLRFAGGIDITGPDKVESFWYGRSVMGVGTNSTNGDLGQKRLSASPVAQIVTIGSEFVREDQP